MVALIGRSGNRGRFGSPVGLIPIVTGRERLDRSSEGHDWGDRCLGSRYRFVGPIVGHLTAPVLFGGL